MTVGLFAYTLCVAERQLEALSLEPAKGPGTQIFVLILIKTKICVQGPLPCF